MTLMDANTPAQLELIIEAALMVAAQPLTAVQITKLFTDNPPSTSDVRAIVQAIQDRYTDRGIELKEVASGFQFQAKAELSPWLSRLWEEKPPRYSRAFLETLSIIAYRQPVTRAEIEDIRGVGVSASIFKTLLEREWIRQVGYKEVPGKPAIYGTTKAFLDYFNLKSLRELPVLADLPALTQEEKYPVQLAFDNALPISHEAAEETEDDTALLTLDESEEEIEEQELAQASN